MVHCRRRDKTNLVEEALDFALAARLLVLERVRLGAVEVRLACAGNEDARDARGVRDGEHVLERAEAHGRERAVRDRVREVERGRDVRRKGRLDGRFRVDL